VGLFAILLVGLAVRIHGLNRNSLWADEFLSLECSSGWARSDQQLASAVTAAPDLISLRNARRWTTIWSSIAADENHPPLYFILLRGWRSLFGDSECALRSMSVAASMVCLMLIFLIGTRLGSPAAGLWASLLMALAGPQIEQAQDARSYTLMLAAVLSAALALVWIDQLGPNRRRCTALVLFTLAAPLIHYLAFAAVAALLLYALLGMRGSNRAAALGSVIAGIVIYAFVWGPAMVAQHYRMVDDTRWLIYDQPGTHGRNLMFDLLTLPARFFLNFNFEQDELPVLCFGGVALLVPMLLYRRHRIALLLGLWLLLPVAVVELIDIITSRRTMGLSKYTIASAPAMFLMLGLLAANTRRVGWTPAALIALGCVACLPSYYNAPPFPNWRDVGSFIDAHASGDDPVLFVDCRPNNYSAADLLSAEYYRHGHSHPLYVIDRPLTGAVLSALSNARSACILAPDCKSLRMPTIPGLVLQRGQLLPGIAVAATLGMPKSTLVIAQSAHPETTGLP
jgi:uncharacterized membrane protein